MKGLCNSIVMNHRTTLIVAGLLGALGVGLGAFGAHGLREDLLARGTANAWETAVRYHQLHAAALLALAVWLRRPGDRRPSTRWAALSWLVGVIVFSGSLYWLALGGPRWLGPITPFGGLALMAGWLLLIPAAFSQEHGGTGITPARD